MHCGHASEWFVADYEVIQDANLKKVGKKKKKKQIYLSSIWTPLSLSWKLVAVATNEVPLHDTCRLFSDITKRKTKQKSSSASE